MTKDKITDVNQSAVEKADNKAPQGAKDEKPKQNHRGRGRTKQEKAESFRKYLTLKKQAIELEKRNEEYLILCPASDFGLNGKQFYLMGANSAVIYIHEIAPKIGRKNATLGRDMDLCNKEEKFPLGVCYIQKLDLLEEKLKGIQIKRVLAKNSLVFFKLPRKYTREEVKGMVKLEQERVDNLNKLIYSKVLYPDIHKPILVLKKMVPNRVAKMPKAYRDVIGMEAIKALMGLVLVYSSMTHGDIDEMAAAKSMLRECDGLLAVVAIMNELGQWSIDDCTQLADTVARIRQLIMADIVNKEHTKKQEAVVDAGKKVAG